MQIPSLHEMDLVCFSHLRWDYVFQRPQHLLTRCARERRVFYIEEPIIDDGASRLVVRQDESKVWIVVPYLSRALETEESRRVHIGLIDQLFSDQNITQYISWYYTPMAMGYSRQLKPTLTVYDCMDELSAFAGAPKKLVEYEEELLKLADLVFTGGRSLYEARRNRHPNVHAFPSSIDVHHFNRARTLEPNDDPLDQMGIPHPRLGYFGVIDERMDLKLIAGLANARPDWHIALLGPAAKIDPADLPRAANIHYLGQKAYKDLPSYLAGWDVCLLPFALNESTRYISPTKTPEYLAGGRPVVSTPIQDVVQPYGELGLVSIADGVDAFIKAVETALIPRPDQKQWLKQVDDFLRQNSWDYTWSRMMQLIESALYTGSKNEEPNGLLGSPGLTQRTEETPRQSPIRVNGGSPAFDYLIVGAGFAGSVLAERLASGAGKRVLIVDRRNHIGGNAFDHYNSEGILVHRYGPHIFHTNSHDVFTYLSRFTEWRQYEHHVLASVDGQLVPMPINLDTINRLYGLNLTPSDLVKFFESVAEQRDPIRTSEDVVISKVGRELYEKFFKNYTRKQWDLDPSQLDASVTARVPVRFNRDSRYFTDTYQSMPKYGFTQMFERILDHPRIKIMVNTDYREILGLVPFREMIYTGPVDEYFDYCFGKLPYRSIDFKFESFDQEWQQPVAVINYPNEHLYTRVTEFKHLTGQRHPKTTLVYEYPTADGDPYYPIPRPENAELYRQYQKLAASTAGVYFAGRLATYKYYNMDQVVAQALTLYAKISGVSQDEAGKAYTPTFIPATLPKSEKVK
ncbi:MAG TPA: UDP-galactopyranose mutase [Anaerolineaceae bacterium]|nr:UDP-galactopyranose mutase [Anaerolineaceae bacterium]